MRTLLTFVLLLAVTPVAAQRADSAAAARRLLGAAARALAAGDTAAAADSAAQASRVWPRQGAYRLTAARLAAAAHRPEEALTHLRAYAAMGFAWRADDPAFASLDADPAYRATVLDAEANGAPVPGSAVFRTLPDAQLHPEGIAFDPRSGRIFVSSIRQRKVIVIDADGRVRDFVGTEAGFDAVFGIAVDTTRKLLWLASGAVPEQKGPPRGTPGGSELVAVSLDDGRTEARWSLPDTTGAHLLGDVVIAPDGRVYATDAVGRAVYRVPQEGQGGVLERMPWRHQDWVSLQGLTFAADGRTAWLADWTTGLFVVEVVTGTVRPVGARATDYTLGVDGLYRVGDRLIGLQNGVGPPRVVALELTTAGDSVTAVTVLDRHLPLATEPTLGVLVPGGLLYVANSPWGHYRSDGTPDPARPFPEPVLLRLPLP